MTQILPHLYEMVAKEAMFGIVVFDGNDHTCLFINQRAQDSLGFDNPTLKDLLPTQERPPLKSFSQELLLHDGFYQDILVAGQEGGVFIANIGVKLVAVDGHQAHLLMIQDVTLQKKLQREITAKQTEIKAAFAELVAQNQKLKELDLAKDRFIALTTHELRTPLSAMVASAEILKLNLYDSAEQQRDFINMIYDQGLHLQDLVNDILDFAKIQAGKMDYYIECQDAALLVKAIARNFESMAEANSVKLNVETTTLNTTCFFDEVRLRQIISNIINNAIKFNRPQGTVRVHFDTLEGFLRIHIEDTGRGIDDAQKNKVFNEFETVGAVSAHHKGTGLGMPISRKLTEGMGGKIYFTSQSGIGTQFTVELPKEKILDEVVYRPRGERLSA